jgi:hypothetical protein
MKRFYLAMMFAVLTLAGCSDGRHDHGSGAGFLRHRGAREGRHAFLHRGTPRRDSDFTPGQQERMNERTY